MAWHDGSPGCWPMRYLLPGSRGIVRTVHRGEGVHEVVFDRRKAIEEAFHELATLSPQEQGRRLEALEGDPELRAEVERFCRETQRDDMVSRSHLTGRKK